MAFSMTLMGDKRVMKKLRRLSDATQRRIVRRPLASALTPISKMAKQRAPKKTGALRRSIGKVVKMYRWGVWGGVGPRTGGQYEFYDDQGKKHVPANYAHLIELGTMGNPAKPFLRPALDTNRARALGILAAGIRKNLEKEARKK